MTEPKTLQQIIDELPEAEQRRLLLLAQHARERADLEQQYLATLRLKQAELRLGHGVTER